VSTGNGFEQEVAAIRETYAGFQRDQLTKKVWAPFEPDEAAVRAQQLLTFAQLLRGAGRVDLEGLRILDLGCGTGRHLRQFLDMGAAPAYVAGVDLDETSLRKARALSPNIRFELTSGGALPFDTGFDLVTHHFVFSSIPSPAFRENLAAEMLRVTRAGGLIYWWDMIHMAAAAGGAAVPLDARDLFPGLPITELRVSRWPAPATTLRASRWKRLLAPLLARLAHPPQFQAALIRKPD
jgi:SAM-dependent methyltransferase